MIDVHQNLVLHLRGFTENARVPENECKHVQTWLQANKLSLNVEKSNYVLFRPPQKKIPFKLKLYLNDNIFNQVTSIKYLGIFFDENLNWKPHVLHVCSKIKRGLGILSKLRHFLPTKILISIYYSLRPLSYLRSSGMGKYI